MKVLTTPSQDGNGFAVDSADLVNTIYKLGKIEYKAYDLIEDVCDNYCRHTIAPLTQEELDSICDGCPLNKLHDLIYKGEKANELDRHIF